MTTPDEAPPQLTVPTEEMLLDAETADVLPELDRIVRGRVDDRAALDASIEASSSGPPIMYTRGGSGLGVAARDVGSSILDGLLGLYVPTEAVPVWRSSRPPASTPRRCERGGSGRLGT